MKGIVLYRSHFGNTKLVAETIARQLTTRGHEASIHDVRQDVAGTETPDFIFIGSPTRFARPDGKTLNVLKDMRKRGLTGIPVAVFDTYGPDPENAVESGKNRWLSPGAAGIMQREAEKQGLKVHGTTLRCAILGGQKGPLEQRYPEKVSAFINEFLTNLVSRT